MEDGQSGAPGVPAMLPVVQEFSLEGENVQTHHPAMEEPTALVRWAESETATPGLVFRVIFQLFKSVLSLSLPIIK